ncbi:hypothetical protein D3C72_2081290 [compost metagenome]
MIRFHVNCTGKPLIPIIDDRKQAHRSKHRKRKLQKQLVKYLPMIRSIDKSCFFQLLRQRFEKVHNQDDMNHTN